MKVTNEMNLPEAFVKAVSVERHNKRGCYSATTLNKGAKETILQERHWDELTEDASDNVWAVFGTAVHAILENESDENFHEERFEVKVGSSTVTGIVDSYDMKNGIINDWKTASVYKVTMDDFSDWYSQGMTYAWLLSKKGLEVRKCRFIALLKDFSKSKAKTTAGYPKKPVYVYEFDVTAEALAEAEKRIVAKVAELEKCSELSDDDIEPCSKAERWTADEKWAVMKDGRKTAVKLFDNEAEAEKMAAELGKGHRVEHRRGADRKCEDYCSCCGFCNYYRATHGF